MSQRFNRVCRMVSLLFRACAVLAPIITLYFWFNLDKLPELLIKNNIPFAKPIEFIHPLPFSTEFIGFAISMIPAAFIMFIFYNLGKLFANYARDTIFSVENVYLYRRVGFGLFLWVLSGWLYDALIGMYFIPRLMPAGSKKTLLFVASGMDFTALITGITIILIAWVMQKAHLLENENKFTI